MDKVTIFLSEEEAKKYIEWQKNYATFNLLLEKGVFNVTNGNVVLHFDKFGTLQTIERGDILYMRRLDKVD